MILTAVPRFSSGLHCKSSPPTPSGDAVNVAFALRLGGPSTNSSVTLCASSHSLFIYYHTTHEPISHTIEKRTHLIKDPLQILIIVFLIDSFRLPRFLLLLLLDFLGRSSLFLRFSLGLRCRRLLFRHRVEGVLELFGEWKDQKETDLSAYLIGVELDPRFKFPPETLDRPPRQN